MARLCVIDQRGRIFHCADSSNPWSSFFSVLDARGFTFVEELDFTEVDGLICLGYHPKVLRSSALKSVPKNKRILINWEPPSVEPELYQLRYYSEFGFRLSPSSSWAEKIEGDSFPWPQSKISSPPDFDDWKLRENRIVIIQANKFSAHKEAKYSLRRSVIWSLGKQGILDLYGFGWHSSIFSNCRQWIANARRHRFRDITCMTGSFSRPPSEVFLGSAENKTDVYHRYQLALVIENSLDYVSEKLFDAISGGCLTVYVGSPSNAHLVGSLPELIPKPSASDVIKAVELLLKRTDEERYQFFQIEYQALTKYGKNSLNFDVLGSLARECADRLEESKNV